MAVVEILIKTIDQSKGDVGKLSNNLAQLAAKYLSVGAVAGAAYKVIQDSIKTTLDYANSVRTLSELSGQSTEETSRFIQVLDDYKITTDDALVATRALTKNGHAPSIETLAKLSDEYLSLNSVEEQNKFILDNLGKGGVKWVEVLNKGSQAILEQGAAVNKALILSQKQVDAARENEIAMDNWNDSVQALKISIGNDLLPVMTKTINHVNALNEADKRLHDEGLVPGTKAYMDRRQVLIDEIKTEQDAAAALMLSKGEMEKNTQSAEEDAAALEKLTKSNQDYLSALGEMTTTIQDYRDKQADLLKEHDDLIAKKQDLIAQGWWPESDKIQEVNQKLAENAAAQQANATEFELATNRRILARTEELLAADGLTEAEKIGLIERGIAMGVYTEEAGRRLKEEERAAQDMAAALRDIPKTITTTINTYHNDIYSSSGSTVAGDPFHGHASGGTFEIPTSYGNEGFRMGNGDTASGGEKVTITPKGGDMIDYKRLGREVGKSVAYELMKAGG